MSSWSFQAARRTHPLNSPNSAKVFVMLQCYMDDSGTHEDAHNCVIGGYWGGINEWRKFEREWSAVLRSEGIKEFHAKDFWFRFRNAERKAPYKGWSDERHLGFIDRLLTVIERRKIVPFAYGVLGTDWKNISPEFQRVYTMSLQGKTKSKQPKPVFLPFQWCVVRTARYCKPGKVMHFIFDYDHQTAPDATRCYADIKRGAIRDNDPNYRSCLGELKFEDSKTAIPLQAADLLAYEAHRYAKKAMGNPKAPMRIEYRRALAHIKTVDDFGLFDAPRLKRLEQAIELNMRNTV